MRSAWLKTVLLIVSAGAAYGQTNPHTQIRWPPNCSDNNYMTYNYLLNSCIHVGPVGASGQVQVNQSGAWAIVPGLTYDFVSNTLSAPNINVPGKSALNIPPTQVTWPPSCTSGTYVPATNQCVPTGTAGNPGGSTGQMQYNAGGTFAGFGNFTGAGSTSTALFPGTLAATTGLTAPKLTLSGPGCGAGAYALGDGSGCAPTINLSSPGPIGDVTPSTGAFTTVNGIPASTLAYVDPTSSIQTQINSNATGVAGNTAALAGKAASNAATIVNGVSCALSGSCTVAAAALTPKGAWVNTTVYNSGDLVSYLGANYSCITGCTAGVLPTSTANWLPIYGTSISLSAANTWTALQTFSAGIAGTKASFSQATPANSAGFSNFGGSQSSTTVLAGGVTIYDNGVSWSEGLAHTFKGSAWGIALYANSGSAANVFLCPTASGAAYPVAQASFNCPYTFSATTGLATSGLPISVGAVTSIKESASQATPANSSGFSNFGGSQFSSTALAGGVTIVDNGANWSEGLALMFKGSTWGMGLYTNRAGQPTNIFLCPSDATAVYPVGQASFNCPYTFSATTGLGTSGLPLSVGGVTAAGPVGVASPSALIPGGLTSSDPIASTQAATSVVVTLAAKVHKDLPVKSPVTYSSAYHAFGDSITYGLGATSCTTGGDCYVQDVARGIGATATNYGVSGDYSCDAAKKVFNTENPGVSGPIYTLMIGTNDANLRGTGAYEANYILCHGAALSWLAVQSASKVAGSTFTGSGFSNDTQYSQVTGTQSTTNGATATGAITTFGGPVYLWYEIIDGNGGTFTYALNGGTTTSVNAFPVVPIATSNGTTRSVAMLRIPPPAAGVQSITITVTSATGAGNVVGILAIGTPQRNAYYVGPVVVAASVPYQLYDGKSNATAQYTLDALANQQQLAADGLDLRFADVRSCMSDGMTSEMNDTYHPNPAGHQELANCFIPLLQSVPGRNVNRYTPANSAAACTQSDLWSDASYVYACIKSGQIARVALAAF